MDPEHHLLLLVSVEAEIEEQSFSLPMDSDLLVKIHIAH